MVKCEICGTEVSEKKMHIHMRKRHPGTKRKSDYEKPKKPPINDVEGAGTSLLSKFNISLCITNSELRKNAKNFEKTYKDHGDYLLFIANAFMEVENFPEARKFFGFYFENTPNRSLEEKTLLIVNDLEDILDNGVGSRDKAQLLSALNTAEKYCTYNTIVRIRKRLMELEPEREENRIAYIDALHDADRLDEGMEYISSMNKEDKLFCRGQCRLGVILCEKKQVEEGIALLEKYIEKDRGYCEGWLTLGYETLQKNDPKRAIEYFNKAINANKNDPVGWYYKYKAYLELSNENMAMACLQKAAKINVEWVKDQVHKESQEK